MAADALITATATVLAVVIPLAWQGRRNRKRVEKKVDPVSNGFAAGVIGRLERLDGRVTTLTDHQLLIAHRLDEHIAALDREVRTEDRRSA